MIDIVEKMTEKVTSWCIACINQCGSPDFMICDQCRGHIETYHTCPECNLVEHFYGYDTPELCVCGFVWPDLNLLKTELEDRIEFHLEP